MDNTNKLSEDVSVKEVYERLVLLEDRVNINIVFRKNQLKQVISVMAILLFMGLVNAVLIIIHVLGMI